MPFHKRNEKTNSGCSDWLTDEHKFYAQELLRMQFPAIDGWQSPILDQNNGFLSAKMDAIQIHIHVVSDSHWVSLVPPRPGHFYKTSDAPLPLMAQRWVSMQALKQRSACLFQYGTNPQI